MANAMPNVVTFRTYDPLAVANYFLANAKAEHRSIDPIGIQKLVYFAHGWSLALFDRPLISEPVEALEYGPAIRSLYEEFKRFGNGPITDPARRFRLADPWNALSARFTIPTIDDQDTESRSLLDRVWDLYKELSSIQLANLTLLPGTPWRTARDQGSTIVPDGLIKGYFRSQINGNR